MKPSRLQYWFAGSWPVILWLVGFTFGSALTFGWLYWPAVELYGDWDHWLVFLRVIFLALFLGNCAAILVGWFVLGPLYYDRSKKNGEPFHEGDMVHILTGPHCDRVARVDKAWDAAPWAGAHQIQVALGEKARQDGSDVFESRQIVRVSPADLSTHLAERE
jgi:amino acid permease